MPRHEAPITGAELHRAFRDLGVEIRPSGGGKHPVATINGLEVRIPRDERRDVLTPVQARRLAVAFGCGQPELREVVFGRQPVNGGAPKAALADGPSKADVLAVAVLASRRAQEVHRWLQQGTHGTSLYARARDALHVALDALDGWPPLIEGAGPEGPDDAGYQPARVDPVLTGPARATGLTAAAVRRGHPPTKWQHDQHTHPADAAEPELAPRAPTV